MADYLLTGSTGVLGSEVLFELIKNKHNVHCLVRAKTKIDLDEKKRSLLSFLGLPHSHPNIFFYKSDLMEKNLGLNKKYETYLAKNIDFLIHTAGRVQLNQSLEESCKTNLVPAKNVSLFCEKAIHYKLKQASFVTSVGVSGKNILNLEEKFYEEPPLFHNHYEESKYKVETFIKLKIDEGLPYVVVRPSMIIGHSKSGRIRTFQVFYHICEFLLGHKTFYFLPDVSHRYIDIIPSDLASQSIVRISSNSKAIGLFINICSGKEKSLNLKEIEDIVQRNFLQFGFSPQRKITIPKNWMNSISSHLLKKDKGDNLLSRFNWVYQKMDRFKYIFDYLYTNQYFLNEKMKEYSGISVPHPNDYLNSILKEYIQDKYGFMPSISDDKSYRKEIKKIEFSRDYIWPYFRTLFQPILDRRCRNCGASEKLHDLNKSGVCIKCLNFKKYEKNKQKSNLENELYQLIQGSCQSVSEKYDALVLYSGGKDSNYLIHYLKTHFPLLRILALSIDNSFMSPVSLSNINLGISKLFVDHQLIRPNPEMMRKMYAYAFTHLNKGGSSGTVDQFDGDLIHDIARNYAYENQIPLIFSGLSKKQVQKIIKIEHFMSPPSLENSKREVVAGISLNRIFTKSEMNWWWKGVPENSIHQPKMIFPFYVLDPSENEIVHYLEKHHLVEKDSVSPLLTNTRLVPLMAVVDIAHLGYSSFEEEFTDNVREGRSQLNLWRSTFEITEFMGKTGIYLTDSIDKVIAELGLSRKSLGLKERQTPMLLIPKVFHWIGLN